MQPYGSLENYISSFRKKMGLSQADLAFLLGDNSDRIRRYEQTTGLPKLEVAIGMSFAFDEPIEALFAGVSERMRDQIATRARELLQQMSDKPTPENAQKLETLDRLGHLAEDYTWRDNAA